jgi:hypothetical protein
MVIVESCVTWMVHDPVVVNFTPLGSVIVVVAFEAMPKS